jgi:ribulose bisphosphate carboxylase small subunit
MPYYIYRIVETAWMRQLEPLADFPTYREAAAELRRLRSEHAGETVRMIFADNRLAAEELLSEARPPQQQVVAEDD